MIRLKSIILVFGLFFLVSCASKQEVVVPDMVPVIELAEVDTIDLQRKMSEAIRIPTRSLCGEYVGDGDNFIEFHKWMEGAFPMVTKCAERTVINKYSIVYRFEGKDSTLAPGAFMAHIDVVPEGEDESWTSEPFGGEVRDGYVYGRGAQDMKSTLVAMMQAMEILLADGFKPDRDLYFCFGHDEEVTTTDGAKKIAKWFAEQDIRLEFLVDEGGTIVDGSPMGMDRKFALIGVCEKGYVDLKLTVRKTAGHGSLAVKPTAVSKLMSALLKLERKPMKPKVTPSLCLSLKILAPYLPKKYRGIASNPERYRLLIKNVFKKNPLTESLISTTFVPTMLNASDASNVVPEVVSAVINTRIIPGYTCEDVKEYVQDVVGKKVEVSYVYGTNPTPMSDVNSIHYKRLMRTIEDVYSGAVVVPYMFIANTDSRYYRDVCDNIFLFTPFELTSEDQKRIHGVDERCSVKMLGRATQFFVECIEMMGRD